MHRSSPPQDTPTPKPLVSCTGIATFDTILGVSELPTGDGKWSATWMIETGGGVAANAAVAVARLGGRARFIGCVGHDPRGRQIRQGLVGEGVLVDSLHQIEQRSTPASTVLVADNGERMIVNHLAVDFFEPAEARWATNIADAQAVLVDLRWLAGATESVIAAKRAGIPAIVDVDRPIDPQAEIFTHASHLLFSRDALCAMTDDPRPVSALTRLGSSMPGWLGVTLGGEGVVWLDGDRVRHLPAHDIDAVDTLGAGDTFHGAFALALAEGRPECEALHFANAAAAIKCLTKGGRSGIPTRSDVRRFTTEHPPCEIAQRRSTS